MCCLYQQEFVDYKLDSKAYMVALPIKVILSIFIDLKYEFCLLLIKITVSSRYILQMNAQSLLNSSTKTLDVLSLIQFLFLMLRFSNRPDSNA